MDLSSLIRKPRIEYTPEHVELPAPASPVETPEPYIAHEEDVTYVVEMAAAEIQALDDLTDALISAMPADVVDVPDQMRDLVGKDRVTMSDYLRSMSSEDYGPVAIREIYEAHAASDSGEPGVLTLPLVEAMRSSLASSYAMISDQMLAGQFPTTGATDAALWSVKCDVDDSQRLREEVSRAAVAAKTAIDRLLWANVLDVSTVEEIRARGAEIADSLNRIKAMLKISSALYATDWSSAASTIRDHFYSALIDTQMNTLFSIYSSAYDKTIGKASKALSSLTGNQTVSDSPEIRNVVSLLVRSIDHVTGTVQGTIADIYAIRRKRTEFALSGAQAVGAMVYTRRLLSQLDTIIGAVQTITGVTSSFPLSADAMSGPLANILNDKRVYQISPTDAGFAITTEALDTLRSRLPQVPDPLKERSDVSI